MADQNKPQDDLSIEEILGSIRRIIAEDDEEPAVNPPAETPEDEEEPLELTNRIEPDGTIIEPAASLPEPQDELVMQDHSYIDRPDLKPSEEYAEKIILVEEPVPMALEEETISFNEDSLLSSTTAEATSAVMAKLARHTALLQDSSRGGAYGPSIESIVRELLKPMLKTWLDDNLPDMVQKMVEREIERLVRNL